MTRTLKLVLLGSLVLNILLLGEILGRLPRSLEGNLSRQQRMEQGLKNLPEPMQARFREKFQQIRAAGDPLRDQLGAAREEALRLIGAEPFDEAAYDRQLTKVETLRVEMFRSMGAAAKEIAKAMPADERRMFADLLRRPSPPAR